jgi:OOP family OmpA-OmpF porin
VGAGQQRITDHVIFVTDASGTMYSSGFFPRAKALTQSLVAGLPDANVPSSRPKPYQAGLVGFGGTKRMVAPLGAFDRAALAGVAAGLTPLGTLDGRGGETPYRHVFPELGTSLQGRSGRAALVIVSDGRADQRDRASVAASELVSSYDGELCIHTVRMGDDPEGIDFLDRISALTSCGSATTADAIGSADGIHRFLQTVMLGAAPVPVAGPCDSVLRLRGIEFAFDKYDITPESAVVLDVAAEQINACPNLRVSVEGHTDFIGTEEYNQGLSERRANSAKTYLVNKGIAPGRMQTKGFGETRPIAPGRTDDDRARNRRVEIVPIQ